MSTWILTTGNSDLQLKHQLNWSSLFDEIRYDLDCDDFNISQINPDDSDSNYTAPARVLGMVYTNQPDYYEDLIFPLIETFSKSFEEQNIKPERIIVLLTDQLNIFSEEKRLLEQCPYWQDTITLQPLLKKYFIDKFQIEPEFEILQPTSTQKGLDRWEETLSLVKDKFQNLNCKPTETVYVSHQAGTPAISSAVQFVSLGKFKNVKFVVSNQYYDEDYNPQADSEIIDSSAYWRGLQIQKAKQLITSGFPGAALKVLDGIAGIKPTVIDDLQKMVNFFNLYSPEHDKNDDFTVESATQRVVDSLDLIGILFHQKNYLQGIALLMAAHETFLKTAILSQVQTFNSTINLNGTSWKVSDLIGWVPLGLFLNPSLQSASIETKNQALTAVKFPVEKYRLESDKDFRITNRNFALISWLKALEPKFTAWDLMEWYCNNKRDSDSDLRNQLMHNLRGMKDTDVVKYLTGVSTECGSDVQEKYNQLVKTPFFQALQLLKLPFTREKLQRRLQTITDALD